MTRLYWTLATLLIVFGFMMTPQLALANSGTGTVVMVRSCSNGSGGVKVVIKVDFGGRTFKTIYLGTEAAGSTSGVDLLLSSWG